MNKKHSLFVVWGRFPPFIGGGAARGYRLYKALSDRGYQVTVFTAKPPGTKIYERVSPDFQIIKIPPSLVLNIKKGWYHWGWSMMASTIRYFNLYLFLLYFSLRQKPNVIVQEGSTWVFDNRLNKYLRPYDFPFAPSLLLKKLTRAKLIIYFTGLWRVPKRYFINCALAADKIIAHDKWMENALRELGVKSEIFYLPVCVDVNRFRPSQRQPSNKVLIVGRLSKDKACDILIKAAPEIISKVPDCKIIIVGDGSEVPALKRMAEQLNIMPHVVFTGAINHHQIEEVYRGVKVLVNPLRTPGIGNVTIEAMACGIPVVKSIIDGYCGYPIEDGENGYLFRVDDYQDLADKVVKILQNPRWEVFSSAARETAEQFDIQASVDKLEQIIGSVTQVTGK